VIVAEPERERLPPDRLFATQRLEHVVGKTVAVQLEIGQVHIVHVRDLRMRGMADEDEDHQDPVEADPMASLSAVWYWVVVFIVLFMVGVIVLAIIETHAQ
jgi:hypothetical protein